jgi:hypothetical protein
MSPAGRPTNPVRKPLPTHLFVGLIAVIALAAIAFALSQGGTANAETVSYLPASAGCSNSGETNDTPAACAANAGTMAPGGGVAIVENDNAGDNRGDDDLQVIFDLGGLDTGRVTGASLRVGSSTSGDPGTIELGGPSISDTNYGSVSSSGGTASSGALVNAVRGGGSLSVWLQVDCQGASNDCGAAIDFVRLNVELEDQSSSSSASLVVSGSSNRSGASSLDGAHLEGNAYIYVSPADGVNRVAFYLDDPQRNSADTVENALPYDFGGTNGDGSAGSWNADSLSDGTHTMAAVVTFNNGSNAVVNATFTTGDAAPAPSPGSPDLLVSTSPDRSNSSRLDGSTVDGDVYVHVWPDDGVNRVRFFLDDPQRNSADRTENLTPFDFGGTTGTGSAGAWDTGSVSSGTHTIAAEVSFSNGSSTVVNATFEVGSAAPPPSSSSYDVYVSLDSSRANPELLDGQEFDGNIYVFLSPGNGIAQARFWLDDRNRSGAADHVENAVPWDFAGGSASQAGALDTRNLSEGTHWITVEIDLSTGTDVIEGSFDVVAPTSGSGGGGGGAGTTSGGGGVSIPAGAVRINPGQSIQAFVNAYPGGTAFVLGSGVHRMQTVVPKQNQRFYGESGTVMNGSRVLTNWVNAGGGQYYAPNQTQQVEPHGGCDYFPNGGREIRCQYAEMVFINGTNLKQVFSRSNVRASTFYFDYGANRIYIGQSPGGKFIEASVREHAFDRGGANVTVAGIVVEKYSTPAQQGAIHMASGWTVIGNEVRWNHGYGIRGATNGRILNNNVHHNGQMGIGGVGSNILIQGNEVAFNHWAGFLNDWERGGMKFAASTDLVFRNNYVHDNDGRGIWTDIDVKGLLIEDNLVESNHSEGIKHELSYDAVIRNNVSRYNGTGFYVQLWGAQILIQNSSNVEVYGNEVWVSGAGGDGIGIVEQNRGSGAYGPWVSRNNNVHHNEIHHNGLAGDNGLAGGCSSGHNNTWDYNTYYAPRLWFTYGRFEACGPKRTWNEFRALGWEAHGTRVNTN